MTSILKNLPNLCGRLKNAHMDSMQHVIVAKNMSICTEKFWVLQQVLRWIIEMVTD